MQNVLTAIFSVESEGYQAFKEIQDGLAAEQYFIPQMALVKKHLGYLQTLDSYESPMITDGSAFSGGLFGSLLGIIGGPLGMLLGGSTGVLIGSMHDEMKSTATTSMLDSICERLQENSVAIVAIVSEDKEEALDAVLSKFAAVIMRHDAAFVAEEVAEAERLQLDLQHQARAHMLAEKKQDFKEKMQKKQEEMKADFEAFVAKFKK